MHAEPFVNDVEPLLARARSGQMPLADLLDQATRWQQGGQAEASARLYEQWIAATQSPLRHVACFNWGVVLAALGRHAEAEAAYRQALALHPGFAQALLNLGHALENQGQPEPALAQWEQALATADASDTATLDLRLHALNNLARLLEKQRRFPEAEARMVQSLMLKPAQPDVIQHYVHIRQKQCEWPAHQPVAGVSPYQLLTGTSALAMLGLSDDPALQLLAAQRFVHDKVPAAPAVALHTQAPRRDGRIRIGYLSGDLCLHAVGLLTVELLELHDRERFEVFAFCWSRDDGTPLQARLRAAVDHHVRLGGVDDATAARLIAGSGIDVLVDLQGLTSGARPGILVQRPAPVQVSYLGLPGTSAVPGVDWIIADDVAVPPALEPFLSERPIRLPRCYQASDRQRAEGATPTRTACGLPENGTVFASFNNNHKFTPEMFGAWMRILQAVPGSVLWLLADNTWAEAHMRAFAAARGVAPERLIFAGRVSPADYLARFRVVDVFLDTFPYNAGTTANDVLWMGTPLVTLAGRSYISRMAASLLTHVGLPELVTETLADYERLAITLGNTPARVASYKRYLAEHGRASPLFDMPGFVRDYEAALERLALDHRSRSDATS